nr:AraC family transcriptional regulator [Pedobacter panaciterrae]
MEKIPPIKAKNQLVLPDDIAQNCSYCLEVIPGLTALIVDVSFQRNTEPGKVINAEDFYIAYYDLSNEINIHQNAGTKVNYSSKLGMVVLDAALKSSYVPSLKTYSFWLLIAKPLLQNYLPGAENGSIEKRKLNNTIVFSSHIDSRTRLCILKLRTRNYNDPSFELSLRGTSLQVFAYLVERLNESGTIPGKLSELDTAQIIKTQTYLMEQLSGTFPGIDFLAAMAGMSVSKYKKLFKSVFKESPNSFFLREKLHIAQELLMSGNFNTINEIAYELGYVKSGYFASIYKKQFGQLPGEVFMKNMA